MTIIPINGKNERMGRLFKTPKHLLLKDGKSAIQHTVEYMSKFGPYQIVCSAHYEDGLSQYNHVVAQPTKNVMETILQARFGNMNQDLYIVDCDVIPISLSDPEGNTVYLFENKTKNKQYSNFDVLDGKVIDCNEKDGIMDWAGAGIYYFDSILTFVKFSNYCQSVSDVYKKMIASGYEVTANIDSEIFRFGTLHDIHGL